MKTEKYKSQLTHEQKEMMFYVFRVFLTVALEALEEFIAENGSKSKYKGYKYCSPKEAQEMLQHAIETERYEDAAKIKKYLDNIK